MQNRVIKFRIWDYTDKKWNSSLELPNQEVIGMCTYFNHPVRHIYQQFTGLKDKNNKEIYEGDIVKTNPNHIALMLKSDEDCPEYTKGEIVWLCEAWKICQKYIGATYLGDYSTCDCCPAGVEVIGNIFENPELLNIKS